MKWDQSCAHGHTLEWYIDRVRPMWYIALQIITCALMCHILPTTFIYTWQKKMKSFAWVHDKWYKKFSKLNSHDRKNISFTHCKQMNQPMPVLQMRSHQKYISYGTEHMCEVRNSFPLCTTLYINHHSSFWLACT